MAVFVWDKHKQPLMPCSEKRARLLLQRGRAVVHKRYPFTIRLKDRVGGETQPLRLGIDPGGKTTGLALMRESNCEQRHVLCLFELVRFDTQKLDNPEISGVEYQQGTLLGYEVREYLLEKWGRECAYCGTADTPLEIEHVVPRSQGGSNRVSNLTLACHTCNSEKDRWALTDFFVTSKGLKTRLKSNGLSADAQLARVQRQLKQPLCDASTVNATRWALFNTLKNAIGLPVTVASGGRTKYNRQRLGVSKTHALDAACVGAFDRLHDWTAPTLMIKCTGRGSYQRTRLNRFGFPRGVLMRQKQVQGFQTGDRVKAVVPTGKKAGTYTGHVAVRKTGSFNIQTEQDVVQGISHKHCTLIQRGDGYGYHNTPSINHKKGGAGHAVA